MLKQISISPGEGLGCFKHMLYVLEGALWFGSKGRQPET